MQTARLQVRLWHVAAVAAVLFGVLAFTIIRPFGTTVTPPASAPSSARCPNQTAEPSSISQGQYTQAVICLVNYERVTHGLQPLRMNARLGNASYGHAADMRTHNYFAHVSPAGSTPKARDFRAHYLPGIGRWKIGEDLAWGGGTGGTPRSIVSAWMHSTVHRHEILTAGYRDIGVGVARGSPAGADSSNVMTVDAGFGHR